MKTYLAPLLLVPCLVLIAISMDLQTVRTSLHNLKEHGIELLGQNLEEELDMFRQELKRPFVSKLDLSQEEFHAVWVVETSSFSEKLNFGTFACH